MVVKLRIGKKVVGEGDDIAEARVRLKDAYPGALLYPTADGTAIHVRVPDENGEYPEVLVVDIEGA